MRRAALFFDNVLGPLALRSLSKKSAARLWCGMRGPESVLWWGWGRCGWRAVVALGLVVNGLS